MRVVPVETKHDDRVSLRDLRPVKLLVRAAWRPSTC